MVNLAVIHACCVTRSKRTCNSCITSEELLLAKTFLDTLTTSPSNVFILFSSNAELKEYILIELPETIQEKYPNKHGLLLRMLYGLKQSPREWYGLVSGLPLSLHFQRTHVDH